MSAGSGAFGTKAGFNQSAGGYLVGTKSAVILSSLQVYTPGSGSGGATQVGSFSSMVYTVNAGGVNGPLQQHCGVLSYAAPVAPATVGLPDKDNGALLKDMGKTIVSTGRVFRKYQVVGPTKFTASTFGVGGAVGSSTQAGYLTGYLEVPGGNAGFTPAPTSDGVISRYM
jgi:cystathionine beta-lyase family protein involved in aluminum resistance